MIVGATNGAAPFTGAWASVAGRAAGDASVTIPALAATEKDVTTSDPQDWAFGSTQTSFSETPTTYTASVESMSAIVPSNYSAAHPTIAINTWTPSDRPTSAYTLCDSWLDCQAGNAVSTLNVAPPFGDPGTNLSWYAWTPADSSSAITASTIPVGYAVAFPAGSTTISLITAKPGYFKVGQTLTLNAVYLPTGTPITQSGTFDLPANTTATLSVVGSDGVTRPNTVTPVDGTSYAGSVFFTNSTANFGLPWLNVKTTATSAKLTITLPTASATAGTLIVQSLN